MAPRQPWPIIGSVLLALVVHTLAISTLFVHEERDLSRVTATERAALGAYRQAGKTPTAVDVVELHDCFTIAEIVTQLRAEADRRQVDGARTGLTHTLGGNTATVVVSLFGRD
jgi:acetyl-CoA acetyltransferase